jgi:hypothetical protein
MHNSHKLRQHCIFTDRSVFMNYVFSMCFSTACQWYDQVSRHFNSKHISTYLSTVYGSSKANFMKNFSQNFT